MPSEHDMEIEVPHPRNYSQESRDPKRLATTKDKFRLPNESSDMNNFKKLISALGSFSTSKVSSFTPIGQHKRFVPNISKDQKSKEFLFIDSEHKPIKPISKKPSEKIETKKETKDVEMKVEPGMT